MSNTRRTQQSGTQSGTQNQQTSGTTSGNYSGTGSSRNIYDWMFTPDTPDITNLRGTQEQIDPNVEASYGRRQRDIKTSFHNPLGAATTSGIREASQRAALGDAEQDYGQSRRVAYNDMQQRAAQRKALLAQLTQPRMVQTGQDTTQAGTSTGTTSSTSSGTQTGNYSGTSTQNGKLADMFAGIASSAAQGAGAAALMRP